MDRKHEAELFDHLCRQRRLREWLEEHMQAQIKILVVNPDVEQLRIAQGRAQMLQTILDRLTTAENAAKRQ